MISLHITIYQADDGDRYKVHTIDPDLGEPEDVTEDYEVTAVETEDGRAGFAVVKVLPSDCEGAK